jgi:CheY-like chemotaxis protein
MIMPRMSGLEACRAIKEMRPDIKTLFMSGYTADKVRNRELLAEGTELVMKPISPRDLVRTVRKILDADTQGSRNPS